MEMLRLDWNVVATIVNLLILYVLMKRFCFQPIQKVMDERKKLLDTQFSEADSEKKKAFELKDEYEVLMSKAKEESTRIINHAKEEAKQVYDEAMESAKEESDRMLAGAREKIEVERVQMLTGLESQIASLAMCAAGKIIGRNVTETYDKALYDTFLNEAGEADDGD